MQVLQYKVVLENTFAQALKCKVVLGSTLCKPCSTKCKLAVQSTPGKCFVQALKCKVVLGRALCQLCSTNKVVLGSALRKLHTTK